MTSEVQAPVLNHAAAMARVGDDKELLRELAGLFLMEYPRFVAELREAYAAGDAQRVEHVAHGLKGSVANFGAQQAVDAALNIENQGRAKDLRPVGDLLAILDRVLAVLHEELRRL